jgi:catechol 2,3-dioxygenase-like lactoylglutathione lyase family enzyme
MFSHVMIGANDMPASKKFYDAIFGAIGVAEGDMDAKGRCFWRTSKGVFGVTPPLDGKPATGANGGTIGFLVDSPEQGDAWHAAGLANGGTTLEDPPGIREGSPVYLAYLRDPAGNKICALHSVSKG